MGEITINFDDVDDLLHVSIEGRLLDYEKKVYKEHELNLMVRWLGVGGG